MLSDVWENILGFQKDHKTVNFKYLLHLFNQTIYAVSHLSLMHADKYGIKWFVCRCPTSDLHRRSQLPTLSYSALLQPSRHEERHSTGSAGTL
jgi:hypothetical protein